MSKSKKGKHRKPNSKNQQSKKKQVGLLGDNSKKKKQLLIGIAILSVMAILIFAFIIPSMNKPSETPEESKQETQQAIMLKVISNDLVSDENGIPKNWQIYFQIVSDGTEGEITFNQSNGTMLKQNKMNAEISELTSINSSELELYDFIWIVSYKQPAELGKFTATLENKLIKKDVTLYTLFEEKTFAYLEEQTYKEYERNWDKLISGKLEGDE
jgi:hypothetical protein